MSANTEQRKLAAIMFTDMVGYSALSQRHEKLAQELLEEHRKLLREIFPRFNGTEIKTIGDGFLVEFNSALEAAQCAIEIQRTLAKRNHDVMADRRIELKIGIHIGDVVHRSGDVYGDGVNIASRIEPLAGAGGICVSMDVERQIRNALEARFEKLAPTELKNIQVPMDLFRIVLPWERGTSLKPERRGSELRERRAVPLAWIGFAVLLLIVIAGWFFLGRDMAGRKQGRAAELPAKSIAVLPFDNLSRDPENAYFAEGVQDEILSRLAKVADLKVISRTSTQRFKSAPANLPDIAKQLGVTNILEGSVQKSADQVRVSVQLINAMTDAHLWAEIYDRKLTDIFAVESEIARTIAETLQAKLTGSEQHAIAARPTENLKAFQYYLQGRSYRQLSTREDLLTATRYYERAIEEDRNYALAYAGLADAYSPLGVYAYIAPIEGRRKTEEAARKAVALDDNLAEAHAALGQANIQFAPYNFSLGDRELRRAIELSPSLASAHFYLGTSLVRQGRLDEALTELLKARELDPLSSIIARQMAIPHYFKRDYARALELLRQANELGPALTTTWEIGVYIQNGLSNETLTELEKTKEERKNDSILIYDTGMVYAAQGKRTEALGIIKELEEMSGPSLSQAHWIAKIYATLNEGEMAFSWLERGLAAGAIGTFYKDDPVWDPIRSDPRFAALVEKIFSPTKTPEHAQ